MEKVWYIRTPTSCSVKIQDSVEIEIYNTFSNQKGALCEQLSMFFSQTSASKHSSSHLMTMSV